MELRHLRYFLAVAEALNFTKAAALLRVAQPALSRRVQDLEDEIGVDLLNRSPRGVVLTAEGKLFLDKTRHILKLADESVEQVRALARGEEGELHMGYAPAPTVEILPPALAAFQKAFPRVRVLLHDFSEQELIEPQKCVKVCADLRKVLQIRGSANTATCKNDLFVAVAIFPQPLPRPETPFRNDNLWATAGYWLVHFEPSALAASKSRLSPSRPSLWPSPWTSKGA